MVWYETMGQITEGGIIMAIGDQLTPFTLRLTNGDKWDWAEGVKNGPVILAFFPLAFTPG